MGKAYIFFKLLIGVTGLIAIFAMIVSLTILLLYPLATDKDPAPFLHKIFRISLVSAIAIHGIATIYNGHYYYALACICLSLFVVLIFKNSPYKRESLGST